MNDCAHWLEPMLEAERLEVYKLADENRRLRTLLSEIHTLSGQIERSAGQLHGCSLYDLYNRYLNPLEAQRAQADACALAQVQSLQKATPSGWPFCGLF